MTPPEGMAGRQMPAIEMARQASRFGRAPPGTTVDAIDKLTRVHVARTRAQLLAGDMLGERDEASARELEKLTRKIGILSQLPAAQRTDLCRRMNLHKIRDEDQPLFRQGECSIEYYIPIAGAFTCVSELHRNTVDPATGAFRPPVQATSVVSAGQDMYVELGVGMPHRPGTARKEGATAQQCTATAWPLLRESKEAAAKRRPGDAAKKMSISARRASKRTGGICVVLAIPMQDLIEVLEIPESEVERRGRLMLSASDFFRGWDLDDLHAVSYRFEHHEFQPGEEIVKEHASRNGNFYLVVRGKVDLFWISPEYNANGHRSEKRIQMPCEQAPCFGEHLLCGVAEAAEPEFLASADSNGPCEVLIAQAHAVRPYLNGSTERKFLEIYESRRSIFLANTTDPNRTLRRTLSPLSSTRKSRVHLPLLEDSQSSMPTYENYDFCRFAPKATPNRATATRGDPSRLKYNEQALGLDGENGSLTPSAALQASVAPIASFRPSTVTFKRSTRALVPSHHLDDPTVNWAMNLSSPYSGKPSFSAASPTLGETDRRRMRHIASSPQLPMAFTMKDIMERARAASVPPPRELTSSPLIMYFPMNHKYSGMVRANLDKKKKIEFEYFSKGGGS